MELTTSPVLRKTPSGWLATSAPGDHPLIGVEGLTEEDAVRRYGESRERWRAIHELAEPVAADV